jgi:hypothetical protein
MNTQQTKCSYKATGEFACGKGGIVEGFDSSSSSSSGVYMNPTIDSTNLWGVPGTTVSNSSSTPPPPNSDLENQFNQIQSTYYTNSSSTVNGGWLNSTDYDGSQLNSTQTNGDGDGILGELNSWMYKNGQSYNLNGAGGDGTGWFNVASAQPPPPPPAHKKHHHHHHHHHDDDDAST